MKLYQSSCLDNQTVLNVMKIFQHQYFCNSSVGFYKIKGDGARWRKCQITTQTGKRSYNHHSATCTVFYNSHAVLNVQLYLSLVSLILLCLYLMFLFLWQQSHLIRSSNSTDTEPKDVVSSNVTPTLTDRKCVFSFPRLECYYSMAVHSFVTCILHKDRIVDLCCKTIITQLTVGEQKPCPHVRIKKEKHAHTLKAALSGMFHSTVTQTYSIVYLHILTAFSSWPSGGCQALQ